MRSVDVVVVGGGPAGSSAAARLKAAGAEVLILDKERFPRHGFLTGDSAGLATRDLCEGIGAAIRSGQQAAHAIVTGNEYTLDAVTGVSLGGGLISHFMDWASGKLIT
jgi:flavin-dependent dehydrogenase